MHGGTDGLKPLPAGLYINGGGLVMPLSTSGKVIDRNTFPDLYEKPGNYGLVEKNGNFYFVRQ